MFKSLYQKLKKIGQKLKKIQDKSSSLPVSDESTFYVKVCYEYPFSMGTKDLQAEIDKLIAQYDKIYRATNLQIYVQKGEYQNNIPANIEDVEHLITLGRNELSRRTNESILKLSLGVAFVTMIIALVSCLTVFFVK